MLVSRLGLFTLAVGLSAAAALPANLKSDPVVRQPRAYFETDPMLSVGQKATSSYAEQEKEGTQAGQKAAEVYY
ncbi:hypothetical protein F5Y17DRAFT_456244 [Xylariaceae sp. FL0594]|nr:hypothetical protein F5Y17DRAFT_456244 [Xylariaceae sp. FL0594]